MKTAILCLGALALVGCSADIERAEAAYDLPPDATIQEAITALGRPSSRRPTDAGGEQVIWVYRHGWLRREGAVTTLTFDAEGRLVELRRGYNEF